MAWQPTSRGSNSFGNSRSSEPPHVGFYHLTGLPGRAAREPSPALVLRRWCFTETGSSALISPCKEKEWRKSGAHGGAQMFSPAKTVGPRLFSHAYLHSPAPCDGVGPLRLRSQAGRGFRGFQSRLCKCLFRRAWFGEGDRLDQRMSGLLLSNHPIMPSLSEVMRIAPDQVPGDGGGDLSHGCGLPRRDRRLSRMSSRTRGCWCSGAGGG